jgi:hypothetical protein
MRYIYKPREEMRSRVFKPFKQVGTGKYDDRKSSECALLGDGQYTVMPYSIATGGKTYDFVEVRRENGKEGFAWANQVAVGSIAVVVDEKANMFKTAKSVDITGKMVSRKTIVVMLSETESNGFVEFKAYVPIAKTYLQNFIRLDSLSEKESDIQSSILTQTAEPLKNEGADKVRKDALLEIAVKDYPDSIFVEEIYDLIDSNTEVNISGAELVNTPIKE